MKLIIVLLMSMFLFGCEQVETKAHFRVIGCADGITRIQCTTVRGGMIRGVVVRYSYNGMKEMCEMVDMPVETRQELEERLKPIGVKRAEELCCLFTLDDFTYDGIMLILTEEAKEKYNLGDM